jgi:uncharacterized phage-associated protein
MEHSSTIKLSNWIINYCDRNGIEDVSNIKLQKLLYYCAGICSSFNFTGFQDIEFQAWKYGPVNVFCYQSFKGFGSEKVSADIQNVQYEDRVEETLSSVMKIYAYLEPFQLVEQTHVEEPWSSTWGKGQTMIPQSIISSYFREHYEVGNSRPPSTITNDSFFSIDNIPVKRFESIHKVAEYISSGNI